MDKKDVVDDDKPFWEVIEGPIQSIQEGINYQNVELLATDYWGGGRRNHTWSISADTNGCFDIDMPNHFCYGIEHLDDLILVLVEARNILIKQWDEKYCNWNGKKWEIMENDKEEETN